MTKKEAQKILRDAGFPILVDGVWGKWSRRALADACRGFAWPKSRTGFSPPRPGGRLSKRRMRMLRWIEMHDSKCSLHFRYTEFKCKGNTRGMTRKEDNWIRVSKALVKRLEKYTAAFGKPTIISACRSTRYNTAVGGATLSQHRYAWVPRLISYAADINPTQSVAKVRKVWGIGGIGFNQSSGNVSHVDTRPWNSLWSYDR